MWDIIEGKNFSRWVRRIWKWSLCCWDFKSIEQTLICGPCITSDSPYFNSSWLDAQNNFSQSFFGHGSIKVEIDRLLPQSSDHSHLHFFGYRKTRSSAWKYSNFLCRSISSKQRTASLKFSQLSDWTCFFKISNTSVRIPGKHLNLFTQLLRAETDGMGKSFCFQINW